MVVSVCVFDVYGTLIDLGGLGRVAPRVCDADALVGRWRTKQLVYSWTFTIMGRHVSFETLAEEALEQTRRGEAGEPQRFLSAPDQLRANVSGAA